MTIFSKSLNIDLACRIWDIYMLEGMKAIFQASIGKISYDIGILKVFEKKLLNSEFDDILKILKNVQTINFDEDDFVELMMNTKIDEWVLIEIQKLNDEYIPIINE